MIIGLVGRSRVGKDTAASFFEGTHQVRRLAQPVKDACKVLYGWSDREVESAAKEAHDPKWNLTPRMAMVHLTHAMRQCNGTNFFTKRFFENWDGQPVVIPDVRFNDDVTEIHRRGGITIKITREGCPDHSFEFPIDFLGTTYEVTNDGTVEELKEKIVRCLEGCHKTPVATGPRSDA
jgi:hypothetical protein